MHPFLLQTREIMLPLPRPVSVLILEYEANVEPALRINQVLEAWPGMKPLISLIGLGLRFLPQDCSCDIALLDFASRCMPFPDAHSILREIGRRGFRGALGSTTQSTDLAEIRYVPDSGHRYRSKALLLEDGKIDPVLEFVKLMNRLVVLRFEQVTTFLPDPAPP